MKKLLIIGLFSFVLMGCDDLDDDSDDVSSSSSTTNTCSTQYPDIISSSDRSRANGCSAGVQITSLLQAADSERSSAIANCEASIGLRPNEGLSTSELAAAADTLYSQYQTRVNLFRQTLSSIC